MVNVAIAVAGGVSPSATCKVKVLDPSVVGVPVIEQVGVLEFLQVPLLMDKPSGKLPETTFQV
jgi:hypothetical protein